MLTAGGFERKSKASSEIPSSSLADMAFLLLIFFMVSTTFPQERPRRMPWPEAEATKRLDEQRKDVLHVFVTEGGEIFINDRLIPEEQVSSLIAPLYRENRQLVVSLRADRNTPYAVIYNIQKELQEAGALRLTFYTDLEERMTRRRR
ncbi:MAG TPA: biopolymer transporter ExbD [Longimicrobiales bacterium]|nr:biopolymer transporter ExbD [Longimicrobiales bacterium]